MNSEVSVTRTDVETILEALNAAYYKSLTEDLVDQYRSLDQRMKVSALTSQLEQALEKVTAYVQLLNDETEDNEDVPG
jgi:hypothetical protein